MSQYLKVKDSLLAEPKTWLITGVAGFIGSNLLQELLQLNQTVVGADNFSTGCWNCLHNQSITDRKVHSNNIAARAASSGIIFWEFG